MTFNRQMHDVTLQTLSSTIDSYGQKRQTITLSTTISMTVKTVSQNNVASPYYIDAEAVGLTEYQPIVAGQQIVDGSKTYNVSKVLSEDGRFSQVHLKEIH